MRPIFVDTSAWFALADRSDSHHAAAVQLLRQMEVERCSLITTNHVVAETYTLFLVRLGTGAAREFLTRSRASAIVERVFVSEAWEEAAEELLLHYRDQDFSYVDATSFVTMRRLSIQDAFSYDHHFAAAGFTVLGA